MRYGTSKQFNKQFSKLPKSVKIKAIERLGIFILEPFDQILNNHPLKGRWQGSRSINITSDIRAVYELVKKDFAYFVAIGSHSELYE